MARWIKVDGTEQEVHPTNGVAFTNTELSHMVGGSVFEMTLTPSGGTRLAMFMDEKGRAKGKKINPGATSILRQYRPEHAHSLVLGDVVVASASELAR